MSTAIQIRKLTDKMAHRGVDVLNQLRYDLLVLHSGKVLHADATPADTSPTAVDLPSVIVMANALKTELNAHMASAIDQGQPNNTTSQIDPTAGQGYHIAADATNGPIATANATDLASSEALLNAMKTAFNAHLTQSGVHPVSDTTNTVSTANATDLASCETLANALQTKINAHFALAFQHVASALVSP